MCNLGYLRTGYLKGDGTVGYRCAAEPVKDWVRKGGEVEATVGRKCLCNGLMADAGVPQLSPFKRDGYAPSPQRLPPACAWSRARTCNAPPTHALGPCSRFWLTDVAGSLAARSLTDVAGSLAARSLTDVAGCCLVVRQGGRAVP